MEELAAGPDRLNGYRTMWHILRLRHHMHVPRQLVASILHDIDPDGVQHRKRRHVFINVLTFVLVLIYHGTLTAMTN